MRSIILGTLLLLAGCGGASHSIAGVTIGARVSADDPRVTPGDDEHTLLLRDPGTYEGRKLDDVQLHVEDGVVRSVELSVSARDEGIEDLRAWHDGLCQQLRSTPDSFTPSPLGTPEEGEPWDPVITTTTRCEGSRDGLVIRATAVENSASDFRNLRVTIVAER